MDTSIAANRSFFPQKLHREKLYATKAEDRMVPNVARAAMKKEFFKKGAKAYFSKPSPAILIILQGKLLWYQLPGCRENSVRLFKRAHYHPEQWIHHNERSDPNQKVVNNFSGYFFAFHDLSFPPS